MKCQLCDRSFNSFQSLGKHISGTHKIELKDYYHKYLMIDDSDKYCVCGKVCSFINIKNGYLKHCSKKCSASDPITKDLFKVTSIEKYGNDSPNRSLSVKEKKRKTFQKNYGADNIFCSVDGKRKNIETCNKKYGVDNFAKTEEYHIKNQSTNMINYGVPYSLQSISVREKSKNTHIKRYGVDNFAKTDKGRLISRITKIKSVETQLINNEPLGPCIGISERECLNELQLLTHYIIIRNDKSFRYVVGRFPDGHIPELRLFIQFDERYHFKDRLCKLYIQDDIDCTLQLALLGYIVYRISKRDWKLNKDTIIKNFQILLGNYESFT